MTRAVLQWSGGKDSTLALHRLRERSNVEVAELQTMFNESAGRISWHGVRRETIEAQADALSIPLKLVGATDDYVEQMADVFADYRDRGIEYLAVGDIEEDDPDTPRESAMEEGGLKPFYPLLGESTTDLVREFLDEGFRAKVVVVNGSDLDESFAGREVDADFLEDLPDGVDVGGERGEYHTFVYDGPVFEEPLDVETAGIETRSIKGDPHHYCDLRLV